VFCEHRRKHAGDNVSELWIDPVTLNLFDAHGTSKTALYSDRGKRPAREMSFQWLACSY
jgi:hypothetical protein